MICSPGCVCIAAAAELHSKEEKMTAAEDKGDVVVNEKLMMSDEKQMHHEITIDDTQTVQSKDGAEVTSGLNALNKTTKQGNS